MKTALCLLGAVLLVSCTTLENRRDLYSPRNYYAYGPYTRMLVEGIPHVRTVTVIREGVVSTRSTGDYKSVVSPSK